MIYLANQNMVRIKKKKKKDPFMFSQKLLYAHALLILTNYDVK